MLLRMVYFLSIASLVYSMENRQLTLFAQQVIDEIQDEGDCPYKMDSIFNTFDQVQYGHALHYSPQSLCVFNHKGDVYHYDKNRWEKITNIWYRYPYLPKKNENCLYQDCTKEEISKNLTRPTSLFYNAEIKSVLSFFDRTRSMIICKYNFEENTYEEIEHLCDNKIGREKNTITWAGIKLAGIDKKYTFLALLHNSQNINQMQLVLIDINKKEKTKRTNFAENFFNNKTLNTLGISDSMIALKYSSEPNLKTTLFFDAASLEYKGSEFCH